MTRPFVTLYYLKSHGNFHTLPTTELLIQFIPFQRQFYAFFLLRYAPDDNCRKALLFCCSLQHGPVVKILVTFDHVLSLSSSQFWEMTLPQWYATFIVRLHACFSNKRSTKRPPLHPATGIVKILVCFLDHFFPSPNMLSVYKKNTQAR